jgi:hypothetical protein
MNQNVIEIGLDIDDNQYHGSALNTETGEVITFKCRPTLKGLLGQLDNRLRKCFPAEVFKLCYEASYVGYTLQRDLAEKGYHCDVVAPTTASPAPEENNSKRIVLMPLNWCKHHNMRSQYRP